jgi:AraC-like DNA-binding protein
MIARKLLPQDHLSRGKELSFSDHTLVTETTVRPYACPEHIPGPGILTMLAGNGRYVVNREMMTLDSHQYLLIDRGSRLSIHLPHPGVQPLFLFFHADMVSKALAKQQADLCWLERLHPMNAVLAERLQWLVRLGNNCSSFSALKADAMIRDILQEFIRQALAADQESDRLPVTRRSTRIELFKRLSLAREYILANYSAPVSLDDMAEKAMLNSQHFLRMFRDFYGITPHRYVIDVRLSAAKQLLTNTKEPVSAICRQTGFESLSSFSGLFRQRFGAAPSLYRKKYAICELLTPSAHSSALPSGYAYPIRPPAPTSD